jgi:hypothetical protein
VQESQNKLDKNQRKPPSKIIPRRLSPPPKGSGSERQAARPVCTDLRKAQSANYPTEEKRAFLAAISEGGSDLYARLPGYTGVRGPPPGLPLAVASEGLTHALMWVHTLGSSVVFPRVGGGA